MNKNKSFYYKIIKIIRMINWHNFAISIYHCPICSQQRIFVKLDNNEILIRCSCCRATVVTLSLVSVLRSICTTLSSKHIYELSSRGPLVKFLRKNCCNLTCSEYFEDTPPGSFKNGIQCQDVQKLTYPSNTFDICTSTEVFEHVPDDLKGFSEIYRVLKSNGIFIFTVPIDTNAITINRAICSHNGKIEHLLPPEYHSDPARNNAPILAFRNYGYDIVDKLVQSGFKKAKIIFPKSHIAWGYSRPVIVAYRENATS